MVFAFWLLYYTDNLLLEKRDISLYITFFYAVAISLYSLNEFLTLLKSEIFGSTYPERPIFIELIIIFLFCAYLLKDGLVNRGYMFWAGVAVQIFFVLRLSEYMYLNKDDSLFILIISLIIIYLLRRYSRKKLARTM